MLEGVIIRHPLKFGDSRGWLAEIFRNDEIPSSLTPAMSYLSITHPGVSRGPHEHLEQTDFFCFPGNSRFKVYLWDNREESQTYLKRETFETFEDGPTLVIIPPKIVHAYKNIGNIPGTVLNFPNKLYAGRGKRERVDEVRYEHLEDSPFKID